MTTALRAATAAGSHRRLLAHDTDELRRSHCRESKRCDPLWSEERRQGGYQDWKRAVERIPDWSTVT
ncbi:hypothetical protein GCM10023238_15800 [Streptomyces heliomycini]